MPLRIFLKYFVETGSSLKCDENYKFIMNNLNNIRKNKLIMSALNFLCCRIIALFVYNE